MKKKSVNCDILRIIAFCLVVLVHSLGSFGFYGKITTGPIMLVLHICSFGIFNFYRNYGSAFLWSSFVGYYSFESVIISTLLASIVLNEMKFHLKHETVGKIIAKISYLTFGGYLLSAIFDNFYWQTLQKVLFFTEHKMVAWIVIVLLVILSSLLLSYVVDLIEKIVISFVNQLKKKKTEKI